MEKIRFSLHYQEELSVYIGMIRKIVYFFVNYNSLILILMIYNLLSLSMLVPTVGVHMYMCVNLYMYMLNSFVKTLNDLKNKR